MIGLSKESSIRKLICLVAIVGIISLIPTPPTGRSVSADIEKLPNQKTTSTLKIETKPVEAPQAVPAPEPVQTPAPAPEPVVAPPPSPTDPNGLMAAAGISPSDYAAVDYIVSHEGSWSGTQIYNTAGSGAYGLCQSLPGNKMASAGDDWATNPITQLKWCNSYAISRYGGWWSAMSYWKTHNNW